MLSLNKGAKTSTGDWLLTTSDLEGVKILDTEENFSGDFALTLWTTTTVGAESAVSTSSKMIVSVNPVADDPNLKVRANIVGDEDSGRDAQGNVVTSISEGKPIPLPLRLSTDLAKQLVLMSSLLIQMEIPFLGLSSIISGSTITSLGSITADGVSASSNLMSLHLVPPKDFLGSFLRS